MMLDTTCNARPCISLPVGLPPHSCLASSTPVSQARVSTDNAWMTMPSWLVLVLWVQTTGDSVLVKLASVARVSQATVLQRSIGNNFLSRRGALALASTTLFAKSMSCVAAKHHHFRKLFIKLPRVRRKRLLVRCYLPWNWTATLQPMFLG